MIYHLECDAEVFGDDGHCPHGHEYTPENTYRHVRPDGRNHRVCRECYRVAGRKRSIRYQASEAEQ